MIKEKVFEKFSKKQMQIMAFPQTGYDALICDGAIRSGKTSIMFWTFVKWAMENFDRMNFIVIGKTVGSVVRNVIDPFQMMSESRKRYKIKYLRTQNVMIVERGDVINRFMVFGAKDESAYMLIQGFTAAGCFVDETALCVESAVNQALARCSVEGSRYWFNCNPGSPTHWFYKDWVKKASERNAKHLHFLMTDNPGLSKSVIKRYEMQYTGVFKLRYIDGLWTQAEGLIYPDHETAYEDGFSGSAIERSVSIDYGTQNPFAAIMWEKDSSGVWHAVKEYYYSGRENGHQKTDADYAKDMGEFVECLPNGEVKAIVDPSAASFIAELRRFDDGKHTFRVRKAKNNVSDGIRDTSSAMSMGLIKFNREMARTDEEFKSYLWDDKSSSDKPVKENDHAMDAIRYHVETLGIVKRKNGEYKSVFER